MYHHKTITVVLYPKELGLITTAIDLWLTAGDYKKGDEKDLMSLKTRLHNHLSIYRREQRQQEK